METNKTNEDRRFSALLQSADNDAPQPDEAFLRRLAEQSEQAFISASAHRPGLSRRQRIMRTLKWSLPAAIAAAAVLAIMLLPGGNGNGTAYALYALEDVPRLIRQAKTVHIKGWVHAGKGATPKKLAQELWVDLAAGQVYSKKWSRRPRADGGTLQSVEEIIRGGYSMTIRHGDRTVKYTKVSPFLMAYQSRFMIERILAMMAQVEGAKKLGRERVDGSECDLWEKQLGPDEGGSPTLRCRSWLDPATGDLKRIQLSMREGDRSWRPTCTLDTIERNVAIPNGVFDRKPPKGYWLLNTPETAEAEQLRLVGHVAGDLKFTTHLALTLADGSAVICFSSQDLKSNRSQAGLAEGLRPGGPLPELPVIVQSVIASKAGGQDKGVAVDGRHFVATVKDGRMYEWAIYVPAKQPEDTQSIVSYRLEVVSNPPDRLGACAMRSTVGDLPVDQSSFDDILLGGLAEFSDDGEVPEGITYESLMKLTVTIRASMAEK